MERTPASHAIVAHPDPPSGWRRFGRKPYNATPCSATAISFHAGNHADVLKHLVLVQLIDYLKHRTSPSGSSIHTPVPVFYALDAGHATQLSEHGAASHACGRVRTCRRQWPRMSRRCDR